MKVKQPVNLRKELIEKHEQGFILLLPMNDNDIMGVVEETVYPPGTEKNADFELLLGFNKDRQFFSIGLCKVNEDFKKLLGVKNIANTWAMVSEVDENGNRTIHQIFGTNDGTFSDFLTKVFEIYGIIPEDD